MIKFFTVKIVFKHIFRRFLPLPSLFTRTWFPVNRQRSQLSTITRTSTYNEPALAAAFGDMKRVKN